MNPYISAPKNLLYFSLFLLRIVLLHEAFRQDSLLFLPKRVVMSLSTTDRSHIIPIIYFENLIISGRGCYGNRLKGKYNTLLIPFGFKAQLFSAVSVRGVMRNIGAPTGIIDLGKRISSFHKLRF